MPESNESDPDLIVHASGRFLKLLERDNWEYATRSNASGVVVLVPVTDDNHLVLVEQYRIPVQATVIELPAGLAGDVEDQDESLATAAERELLEETGYQAAQLKLLFECPVTAGMSDEIVTFFEARQLTKIARGGGDESEDITVHCIALEEIDDWLKAQARKGLLVDPKIYSALYWLKFPESAPSA
ncbi:MAG TPA: NUDIX hydrolase [Xanthomonadales bacterium]|nr:NUDIX hydrolase [Xanthomonadales bacterium]